MKLDERSHKCIKAKHIVKVSFVMRHSDCCLVFYGVEFGVAKAWRPRDFSVHSSLGFFACKEENNGAAIIKNPLVLPAVLTKLNPSV